jgi:hypothetical protein
MVSEATTGYICNMEIYAAAGKKLEDNFLCPATEPLSVASRLSRQLL